MTLRHVYTNGVADGTATSVVRPSDWNSAHLHEVTIGGNTVGVNALSGTNIVWIGSNNVTLSGIQGAGVASVVVSAAAGGGAADGVNILAAGTQTAGTTGTVKFADSNGISFGMSNSTQITASYTVPSTAGLISAVNVSAGTTSNNLSALTFSNANGLAFGLNGSVITGSYTVPTVTNSSMTVSDANTSGTLARLAFTNLNGVTLSLSTGAAGSHTIVGSHNGITTGRASTDALGLNTAQTNVTWTADSRGISLNAAGYAGTGTTFAGTNISASITHDSKGLNLNLSVAAGGGAGDGFNNIAAGTQTAATTGTVLFQNSNGVTFGMSNSSVVTATVATNYAGQGFTSTSTAGVDIKATLSTNGLSMAVPVYLTTAQPAGAYLTTARASNDAIGLNTAQSNVTWTANSSGLSLDARGYAGTGTTFAGANVSASITLNSNGLNLSLSGATAAPSPVNITVAGSSGNLATIMFSNANGVSFGLNGSTITASVGAAAGDGGVFAGVSNLGNTAGSTGTVSTGNFVLVGTNGISLSQSTGAAGSAATITINAPIDGTIGGWEPYPAAANSTFSSLGQNFLQMQKVIPNVNYKGNHLEFRISGSFASSTNAQTAIFSIFYGLYSLDTNNSYNTMSTSLFVLSATANSNTAMGYTMSQGAGSFTTTSNGTAIASLLSGFKHLYLPFTHTLSSGVQYAYGVMISSSNTPVANLAMRLAFLEHTIINNLTVGKVFASTIIGSNSTHVGDYNQGVYSTTTGALPAAVAKSQMSDAVSQARLYLQLDPG